MMEKATAPFSYVVLLTYNEETEENRIGARAFRYSDISDWKRRIRDQPAYQDGVDFLRAVVGGERGSRHKRVHWHVPVFSSVDITTLGVWSAPWGVVTEKAHIVGGIGDKAFRRVWSLWPHGYVTIQDPDYGGMRYAVSYAVKDQFDLDNSEGHAREAKSDFGATGKFRPKAAVPVGMTFVNNHLRELAAIGAVDAKPALQVPGRDFPWYSSGLLRRKLLEGYRLINDAHRAEVGRDCPQWSSLVYGSRDSDGDLRSLGLLDEEEPIPAVLAEEGAYVAVAASRARDRLHLVQQVRRRCGSSLPCRSCLEGMGDQLRAELGLTALADGTCVKSEDFLRLRGDDLEGDWQQSPEKACWQSAADLVQRFMWDGGNGAGINPLCALRGSKITSEAFPLSDAKARADRLQADAQKPGPLLGGQRYAKRHKGCL